MGNVKPFAPGSDDPAISTCWDCGHTWKRGQDGSHSCVSRLQAEVERLRAGVEEANRFADYLQRQRDALADALAKVHARLPRWIAKGIEVGRSGRDHDLAGAFADQIEATLRLAGRSV